MRASSSGGAAEVAGRDSSRASRYNAKEIKRNWQGLRRDELSSSEVLDVTVFNLSNLARQTIQHQAESRMLHLIVTRSQTSHVMTLVEGTSLSVSEWGKKFREANWRLCGSDDGHHWVRRLSRAQGFRNVDNCGSERLKIWHAIFEIDFGYASTGKTVWQGSQVKYRVMLIHINHAIARTGCRACRINFADLLLLCAYFQEGLMGGEFNAFSYKYFRTGSQQTAGSLQDSSLAVTLRRVDEGINAQPMRTTRSTNFFGVTSTWLIARACHGVSLEA